MFWGVEVKSGETLKVIPFDAIILHLSQANVGEQKKEKKNRTTVTLVVNIDGKKLVLGTLFTDKLPQQKFNLWFNREFELSHNCKSGSVYFHGYWALNPDKYPLDNLILDDDDEDLILDDDDDSEDEDSSEDESDESEEEETSVPSEPNQQTRESGELDFSCKSCHK
ncbi:histone deacetylase HDT1 [Striga asiatica]|uniref:Histone deacetylase HDT1 n=1 Tax=Striga asiatica TaxID=4170 RepID=A0A5A7PLZ4_STRAF|nr:histone deacetylase HDT1 [Striga asiatica]